MRTGEQDKPALTTTADLEKGGFFEVFKHTQR